LSKAKIPLILTNHTYQTMDLYSKKIMSGGSGLKYAASTIVFLSKKKDKDNDEGNIIVCKLDKSRFTKPQKVVETKLSYVSGLSRYAGLVEIAEKHGIFKKVGNKLEVGDGKKYFEKAINKSPEKFFTPEILEKLEAACNKEFLYGDYDDSGTEIEVGEETDDK
jgi:hypothetical protein